MILYFASVVASQHEEVAKSVCMLNSDVTFDHFYRRSMTTEQTVHAFQIIDLLISGGNLSCPVLFCFSEKEQHTWVVAVHF